MYQYINVYLTLCFERLQSNRNAILLFSYNVYFRNLYSVALKDIFMLARRSYGTPTRVDKNGILLYGCSTSLNPIDHVNHVLYATVSIIEIS